MERKKNKQPKLHIRKGDTVKVLSGNYRGKVAKVLEVLPKKRRAIVEGVNIVTKHIKPSAARPEGGIEKTEAPIHISNLMLVDPATGEPTRTGRKQVDGKWVRYSKKTGEVIK
ncbi:MAG TPA: 50S ribosomal protein L24 [Flammeovirgaceae bacterium]|nr:50S ribosomal protein L24 [Flammeovirgaceae bacterium]